MQVAPSCLVSTGTRARPIREPLVDQLPSTRDCGGSPSSSRRSSQEPRARQRLVLCSDESIEFLQLRQDALDEDTRAHQAPALEQSHLSISRSRAEDTAHQPGVQGQRGQATQV